MEHDTLFHQPAPAPDNHDERERTCADEPAGDDPSAEVSGNGNGRTAAQYEDGGPPAASLEAVTTDETTEAKRSPRAPVIVKRLGKTADCAFSVTFRGSAQKTVRQYEEELACEPVTALLEAHLEALIAEYKVDLATFETARAAAQERVREEARAAARAKRAGK